MRILTAVMISGLAVAMTAGSVVAQAQAGTGSVSGRLVFCKMMPLPVGSAGSDMGASLDASMDTNVATEPSTDPGASLDANASADLGSLGAGQIDPATAPDLSDVTPGSRFFRSPAVATVPAANVEVKLVGLPVSARSDANGQFTLRGVPAAQPVSVAAQLASTPNLTLQVQNLVVSPGQTLDVGTLGLRGCAAWITQPAGGQPPLVIVQTDPALPADAQPAFPADAQPALPDGQPAVQTEIQAPQSDRQPPLIERSGQ
jgi:hypothetical protein